MLPFHILVRLESHTGTFKNTIMILYDSNFSDTFGCANITGLSYWAIY